MGGSGGGGGGVGGGGGKDGVKVKAPARNAQSKTNCLVCGLTCNKIASNRAGGVKCRVCASWFHPQCANLSAELFGLITKWAETGQETPWKCQACDRAGTKVEKIVDAFTAKVLENEKVLAEHSDRLDRVEDRGKLRDTRLDCQEKEIKDLKEQLVKLGDMGGPSLAREMDERSLKQNNLIFHRVIEAGEGDAKSRMSFDKKSTQQLLNAIGVGEEVGVETHIKAVRRLGARSGDLVGEGDSDPRPLLVGFAHQYHSELVLENSWRLAKADNLAMRSVSVVRDLTMRQRATERELHKEAASKNLTRSKEITDGGLVFKVVGKRGSKREILAPLREGEHLNSEGVVVWTEGFSGGGRGAQAMGGRWTGPASASSPNCEPVGRPGGTGRGMTRDTAQVQSTASRSRGGGRGRGGGPSVGRGGGSRDYLGEELGAGRRGSTRAREGSISPGGGRGPPGKRTDDRTSPRSDRRESTPLIDQIDLIDLDLPIKEKEVVCDEFGEVLDDAEEVVDSGEEGL